ncbi:30S ribosomal protein S20 [Candidatus Desulfarcum epimagneticum]|uniref:Small ribosomal subunit protein bS20 n=1 Tax=uncultured Desulfobacteraceae bacterium TaxID=218296 RepID=A0A484HLY4_9BACT|nr:30S ribosomal protein S20 [uncultured Desulfobacteraceae bacterium]
MANHKSALKRARQNEKKRLRNKAGKSRIKHIIKDLRLSMESEPAETLAKKLDLAKSAIHKAAKKGAFHPRTASRKISRLAVLVNKKADA